MQTSVYTSLVYTKFNPARKAAKNCVNLKSWFLQKIIGFVLINLIGCQLHSAGRAFGKSKPTNSLSLALLILTWRCLFIWYSNIDTFWKENGEFLKQQRENFNKLLSTENGRLLSQKTKKKRSERQWNSKFQWKNFVKTHVTTAINQKDKC